MAIGEIIGKVNIPTKLIQYDGEDTDTASVRIDNRERTIAVDVDVAEVTKNSATKQQLSLKVDKEPGKGLSANDFTDSYKSQVESNTTDRHTHSNKQILDNVTAPYTTAEQIKLSNIEANAQVNKIETITVNCSPVAPVHKVINITIPTQASDINALADSTKYGASISVTINSEDYKLTTILKDQNGDTLGTAQVIDLPLESTIIGGAYDALTKSLILTLHNEQEVTIPVDDIISGLVSEDDLATTLQSYYTKTEVDNELTEYVKEGSYSSTTSVGNADTANNLKPYGENSGVRQTHPFIFQSTASGADVGSLCQFKSLRGQSYVLNQLARLDDYASTTQDGITFSRTASTGIMTFSGTATADTNITVIRAIMAVPYNNTHKFLIKWNFKGTAVDNSLVHSNLFGKLTYLTDKIETNVRNSTTYCQITIKNGTQVDFSIQPQIFDLKQLDDVHEITSVVEFNRLFPLPYYQYNAGQLVSSQSSKLITTGYNQFSALDTFIKVVAGQTYTIEGIISGSVVEYDGSQTQIATHSITEKTDIQLSINTQYVKVLGTGNDICFYLTWDKSREGYEEYEKHEYALPNTELRSAGSAYDEIKSSGEHITRIEYVDIKTLINGQYRLVDTSNNSGKQLIFDAGYGYLENHAGKTSSSATIKANILSTLYEIVSNNTSYQQTHNSRTMDNFIASVSQTVMTIAITSHAFDNLSTKQDLLDYFTAHPCYIQYELAEETTEQVASFNENPFIDDFGTMEFNSIYPQGANFFYYADYKAFIDSLGGRQDIGYDASEIVSHTELEEVIGEIPQPITVDELLDKNSLNPVSNSAITEKFEEIEEQEALRNIVITKNSLSLYKFKDSDIKILLRGRKSRNIMPLLVDGTYTQDDMTIIVTEGVIVSATKSGSSPSALTIPFRESQTIQLKEGDVYTIGYSLNLTGNNKFRIYFSNSSASTSGIVLDKDEDSVKIVASSTIVATGIHIYQSDTETYSATFNTPIYINEGEVLYEYDNYGIDSSAQLFLDNAEVGTYDYSVDGDYKIIEIKPTYDSYLLNIVDGQTPIIYGKDENDILGSLIILNNQQKNYDKDIYDTLIFKNEKIEVHANENTSFQFKDILLNNNFNIGDDILVCVENIDNCLTSDPVIIYFIDENDDVISSKKQQIGRASSCISKLKICDKVPAGTKYVKVRLCATYSETTLPEHTVTFNNVCVYNEYLGKDSVLKKNIIAQSIYTKPLALRDRNPYIMSVAHQGCRCDAPSNSLPSFIIAKQRGFHGVEFDINISGDGEYIISHNDNLTFCLYDPNGAHDNNGYLYYVDDEANGYWYDSVNEVLYTYDYETDEYITSTVDIETLTRVTYQRSIRTLKAKDVRRLDYGTWYAPQFAGIHILSLEEALDAIKELGLICYVDFKVVRTNEVASDVVNLIKEKNMFDNSYFTSPTITDAEALRSADVMTNLAFNMPPSDWYASQIASYQGEGKGKILVSSSYDSATDTNIGYCKNNNIKFGVWFDDIESTVTEAQMCDILINYARKGAVLFVIAKYNFNDAMNYKYFEKEYYK